jgi:hypothetical protein
MYMALDIKQAILAARVHFEEILPELASRSDVRVEEIEREGPNWRITLSVPPPEGTSVTSALFTPKGLFGLRTAKVVVINGDSGEFVALRQHAA